jgi:serine protease Do
MVKRVVNSLVSQGKVTRGYLGVSISDLNRQLKSLYKHLSGAIIVDVEDNAPAHRYGFKRGDLVYKIDDKKVNGATDLKQIVASLKPEDEVTFYVERDKKDLELGTVLGSRDSLVKKSLDKVLGGLKLSALSRDNIQRYRIPSGIDGILIEDVAPRSKAEKVGFQAGDVIIQIENKNILNVTDLKKSLDLFKNRSKRVYVNRYGVILMFVTK